MRITHSWWIVAAFLAVPVGTAVAAEPMAVPISSFKTKPTTASTEELVKVEDDRIAFYVNGTATASVKLPDDGEYVISIDASCDPAEKKNAIMSIKFGETVVKENFELTADSSKVYTFTVKLKKGEAPLSIQFSNDAYKEGEFDRNLFIHSVKIERKK